MRKCALPVDQWGVTGELKQNPDTGRELANCVIGYKQNDAGEVVEYIEEPMFVDVLEILQSKKKTFKVGVMIQKMPPVVFQFNNIIVPHNDAIQSHMEAIRVALDTIPTDILMQSLVEARIMKYKKSKGDGLKALEAMVLSKSRVEYHTELIVYVIQQMISNSNDNIGIKGMFREMEQEQIIRFIGAVKEYMVAEETQNMDLSKLLDKFDISEIEAAANREITDRFFLGQI